MGSYGDLICVQRDSGMKRSGANIMRFEQTIEGLRKELQDAVEKEDFERAAELRDKLQDLENDAKALA